MSRLLHVVCCISNPVGFKSRYKLYKEFEKRMLKEENVKLWTVELATGDRPFEITQSNHTQHLQLRSREELWHKENLLNLITAKVPEDGNPIAYVDADVIFTNPHWVQDTLEALDVYDVVQMFQHSVDFGPHYALVDHERHTGIGYLHAQGIDAVQWEHNPYGDPKPQASGHPGYAWAWRRDALKVTGGLFEHSVVGLADWNMCCGLMSEAKYSVPANVHHNFAKKIIDWGERAKVLRRNVGYVRGTLGHYWHGPKAKRGYLWRNSILSEHQIDPDNDLTYDANGVLSLVDDGSERYIHIRNALRKYHRSRNEDSIDDSPMAFE